MFLLQLRPSTDNIIQFWKWSLPVIFISDDLYLGVFKNKVMLESVNTDERWALSYNVASANAKRF